MNCGCFWDMDSAKCEENGPDKCLPAHMYDLDRTKCNECYPLGGMSKVCGEHNEDMHEPTESWIGLGGKSWCELIIEVMGGEGIWDIEVDEQMLEQTHTWVVDPPVHGGYYGYYGTDHDDDGDDDDSPPPPRRGTGNRNASSRAMR